MDMWEFPIKQPELRRAVAHENICPECGGELDTGWECNACNYDAMQEAQSASNVDILFKICYESAMKKEPPCIDHRGNGCS